MRSADWGRLGRLDRDGACGRDGLVRNHRSLLYGDRLSMSSRRGSKTSLSLGRRSSIHALISSSFSRESSIDPSLLMFMLEKVNLYHLRQCHSGSGPASILDSMSSCLACNSSNIRLVSSLASVCDLPREHRDRISGQDERRCRRSVVQRALRPDAVEQ